MRYRFRHFGKALGSWQARVDLAKDEAVTKGHASRDLFSGKIYLNPGITIEKDEGEPPPLDREQETLAKAIAIFRREGAYARPRLARYIERLEHDADKRHWRGILQRIKELEDEARRYYAVAG